MRKSVPLTERRIRRRKARESVAGLVLVSQNKKIDLKNNI